MCVLRYLRKYILDVGTKGNVGWQTGVTTFLENFLMDDTKSDDKDSEVEETWEMMDINLITVSGKRTSVVKLGGRRVWA